MNNQEKITAFGPVATGSINAQLALKAAGTIIKLGSIPAPTPAAADSPTSVVKLKETSCSNDEAWTYPCSRRLR